MDGGEQSTLESMNSAAGTVFIVDDDPQIRTSLSRLLAAAGYRVRAFESADSFLDDQDADTPGCLLLDVCLPGLSGMELQSALDGSPRNRPIVFLTGMGDILTSVSAMKAGAIDFLIKPIDSAILFTAIERGLRRDAKERLERTVRESIEQRIQTLTRRERQVMVRVASGRLNKQIAGELGTGEKTVKVHRGRVMNKMGVRSVAELVQLALRVGVAIESDVYASER
jgi:FixJ family two-component response regulator